MDETHGLDPAKSDPIVWVIRPTFNPDTMQHAASYMHGVDFVN